jgi:hypothetical protein
MHWFDKQEREDQALLIAFELMDLKPKGPPPGGRSGNDVLAAHLAKLDRKRPS